MVPRRHVRAPRRLDPSRLLASEWRINCRSRHWAVLAVKCWFPDLPKTVAKSKAPAFMSLDNLVQLLSYLAYPTVPSETSTRVSRGRRHQVTTQVRLACGSSIH